MAVCEAGSAVMAYFYFDFRDLKKQGCRDLLLSLVYQLSSRSGPCCDILHRVYETHERGDRQPSDDILKECLKEMLRLLAQGRIYIVLDALDECPDSSGLPSPRNEVLLLVKELVDLGLQGLHICATSRPEVDIRAVLEPLASCSVSLHSESGQNMDIADYVRSVVNSSLSTEMRRWREEDKSLVIETLTDRADGMFASIFSMQKENLTSAYRFRWVYCQLDALQHCFPPNLRQFLNELPETLDETYERMLRGINKAQKDNAHRLLQCLTVASRPLRVEELAEVLAFDFHGSSSGGIPTFKKDWRWDNQEQAVLSTCSSLITIVRSGDSPVVQFSHFSVKEYLTSPRLAQSPHGDISRFHIDLGPAHTIMAQACLGTLLRSDERTDNAEGSPLVKYAAQHWVDHARFEEVSLRVQDGIDNLFDTTKPHFVAWLQVHDIDEHWNAFSIPRGHDRGTPLYYAAQSGIYDLAERLITKHPEQVNACGGRKKAPLMAALSKRHFHIAELLHKEGAFLDIQNDAGWTVLHLQSYHDIIDIIRWLLDRGADPNVRTLGGSSWVPLHVAIHDENVEVVQVLLENNADINLHCARGRAPIHDALNGTWISPKKVDIVRRLLKHGADPSTRDRNQSTPLHYVSSKGWLEAARLLLSYGASVDEKDGEGRTPFEVASAKGHDEMAKLLLEHSTAYEP